MTCITLSSIYVDIYISSHHIYIYDHIICVVFISFSPCGENKLNSFQIQLKGAFLADPRRTREARRGRIKVMEAETAVAPRAPSPRELSKRSLPPRLGVWTGHGCFRTNDNAHAHTHMCLCWGCLKSSCSDLLGLGLQVPR